MEQNEQQLESKIKASFALPK